MRRMAIIIFLISTVFSCQQDPFATLNQLNGDWKMKTPKGPLYESWRKEGENRMHGFSYKVNGKDTLQFEVVYLSKLDDGIFYTPVVLKETVPFKLISSANNKFIFENKEHDFPQRIIYHLINKDSVHAWIEGTQNGKENRSDYYFSRVK